MFRILSFVFSIFLFLFCVDSSKTGPEMFGKNIYKSVCKLSVAAEIKVDKGKLYRHIGDGTCFAISEHELITAGHICAELKDPTVFLRVSFLNKEMSYEHHKEELKVSISDESKDLCILYINNNPLKPIKLSKVSPLMGDRVYVVGFFGDGDYIMTEGFYGKEMLLSHKNDLVAASLSAPTLFGSSGAPVLNNKGELVGVVIGGVPKFHHMTVSPAFSEINKFLGR
jgi:S1-C subfamily serine protease